MPFRLSQLALNNVALVPPAFQSAPALSMGKLHHAIMGTAAVAIGAAAAIPGTLVNLAAGGGARNAVRFGHPSGTLRVGAHAQLRNNQWSVTKALMSRSACVLMEGHIRVPAETFLSFS